VNPGGEGLEGVVVELMHGLGFSSLLGTTTTRPGGGYVFHDLENDQYIIVPSLPGRVFTPEQILI
jgi:hypothetical protein